ncbi:prepilin-type N-terminal cleavage/methylation domain-containing protein [Candidatus Wolfebacteria bacterium]|nr:prepilin-type N-terminal cleavage/methylation domain-containing protein [Candidatus Wolfebacteria bacterium]
MLKIIKNKLQIKGFTLIELIVAMSVFVILTSVAVGGFINMMRNQRIVTAMMAVNDNMGLTLEQMAREIRTGYNFCRISSSKIQFVNAKNEVVRYRLNNESVEKGISATSGSQTPGCDDASDSWFSYGKIIADNVSINKFDIKVCGKNIDNSIVLGNCGSGDSRFPPRITLSLSITSAEPDVKKIGVYVNTQTTVSSRIIKK